MFENLNKLEEEKQFKLGIKYLLQESKDQVDKYDNPKNLGWDKIEQKLNLFK